MTSEDDYTHLTRLTLLVLFSIMIGEFLVILFFLYWNGLISFAAGGLLLLLVGVPYFYVSLYRPLLEDLQEITETRERLGRSLEHMQVLDRVLRHNINNELNVVMGLAQDIKDSEDGDSEELAERIIEQSRETLETTDKERRIVEVLSDRGETRVTDLGRVLEKIVQDVGESYPEASIELSLEGELEVEGLKHVEEALRELVTNAVEHNDEPVEVEVKAVEDGSGVSVEVSDNGPTIPEEEKGILTEDREIGPLYHGSGLGLWMVHWIIEESDGSLRFGEDGDGNTVEVVFPGSD